MNEGKTAAPADALLSLLKSSLTASGSQAFGHLVIYTSFGVVRGRIGLGFAQGLSNKEPEMTVSSASHHDVIELNDVTIEHYSNHLPTASFDRLYIRLADVQGYALVGLQGQG